MQWFLFTRQERDPRMRSFDDVKAHGAKRPSPCGDAARMIDLPP